MGRRVLVAWADDRDEARRSLWARVFAADLTPPSAEWRVARTAMGPTASVLFRDQREGRVQAWSTRPRRAIPR